jgi:hypothetical protein
MSNTPPVPQPEQQPAPPKPLSGTEKAGLTAAVFLTSGRIRLFIAAALFIGWMGWLTITALTKSDAPTVSRAQAAAASVPVRAELFAGVADRESFHRRTGTHGGEMTKVLKAQADKPAFVVKVKEQLHPNGPAADTEIGVTNLPECSGYAGPGEYLLLLNRNEEATIDGKPAYTLVGQQRSPGADLEGVGPPRIYPWTERTGSDLRQQVKRLYP